MKRNILYINAIHTAKGWEWNSWRSIGSYEGPGSTRSMKLALGKMWIGPRRYDDDGHNVILIASDGSPRLAIPYGDRD